MTLAEKLNAVLRFSVYFSVIVFLVRPSLILVYLPIFVAVFTYALYAFYDHNTIRENMMHSNLGVQWDGPGRKSLCVLPTKHNPMGNILVSDYVLNPNRPEACDITRRSVKRRAEKLFADSLYRDVDDLWSLKTSSRHFYQTPIQSIPNKQTEFAEWLYKPRGKTCKEGNGQRCINGIYRTPH